MAILKRGKIYQLHRRVPRRYSGVESRKSVWISLHTDSEAVARSKADATWRQLVEAWEARLAGDVGEATERYAAAQDLARARGFHYLDKARVAQLPVRDLVERVEAVPDVRAFPTGPRPPPCSAAQSGRRLR